MKRDVAFIVYQDKRGRELSEILKRGYRRMGVDVRLSPLHKVEEMVKRDKKTIEGFKYLNVVLTSPKFSPEFIMNVSDIRQQVEKGMYIFYHTQIQPLIKDLKQKTPNLTSYYKFKDEVEFKREFDNLCEIIRSARKLAREITEFLIRSRMTGGEASIIFEMYDNALESFNEVLEFKPDFYPALAQKAHVLYLMGRKKEAEKMVNDLLKRRGKGKDIVYYLKACFLTEKKGNKDGFLWIKKALKLQPKNIEYITFIFFTYWRWGMKKEALEESERLIKKYGETGILCFMRAGILVEMEKYEEAIKWLKKAIISKSLTKKEMKEVLLSKSYVLGLLNRNEEALYDVEKCLYLFPDDERALQLKALHLTRMERYDEAREIIDKVLAKNEKDPLCLHLKAIDELIRGNEEEGMRILSTLFSKEVAENIAQEKDEAWKKYEKFIIKQTWKIIPPLLALLKERKKIMEE